MMDDLMGIKYDDSGGYTYPCDHVSGDSVQEWQKHRQASLCDHNGDADER